jgi:trigger factor
MMQVNVEEINPSKLELTIEIDADTVNKTIDQVYHDYAKVTAVPGFRKGKAPRHLLERYVAPEAVRRRAIESMIPDSYAEAIEDKSIEPYTEPEIDVVQFEKGQPFIFKAGVSLPPKVELGEYKGIEVERQKVEITEADIDNQMKYLQDSKTTSEPVTDRGIEKGDVAVAEIASASEGEEKPAPKRSLVEVGSGLPEFDDNLIGMKPDERKTFTVEYPEDYADDKLAGKTVEYDVDVKFIRKRIIPELNDEFAKTLGEFETLAEMREDLKSRLIASSEEAADRAVAQKIIEEIVSRATTTFPDVMTTHEMHHDLEDFASRLGRQGLTVEQYLRGSGKTREQLFDDLRGQAEISIRTGLVLGQIAEAEGLDVTDDEIEAEIDRVAEESKAPRETVETYFEAKGGKSQLKSQIANRKIMEFLRSVSVIK